MRKFVLDELPAEVPSEGVQRRRLVGEKLEMIYYRYEEGSTFPVHAHEAEQLTVVLTGRLVFVLGDEEVELDPGEALLIDGGRPHSAYVPAGAGETGTYNVFTPVRSALPGG